MTRAKDFMIDIESLGVGEDAVILSIGGVAFDPKAGVVDKSDSFYTKISWDGASQPDRKIDPSTLAWWLTQDMALFGDTIAGTTSLIKALHGLSLWLPKNQKDIGGVWANGASFDLGILKHAYKQFGLTVPWGFRHEMCMRSVRRLANLEKPRMGVYHNALDDAIWQAEYVCEAHTGRALVKGKQSRLADFSDPYSSPAQSGVFIDELLYPESRGWKTHKFLTMEDALKFLGEFNDTTSRGGNADAAAQVKISEGPNSSVEPANDDASKIDAGAWNGA